MQQAGARILGLLRQRVEKGSRSLPDARQIWKSDTLLLRKHRATIAREWGEIGTEAALFASKIRVASTSFAQCAKISTSS